MTRRIDKIANLAVRMERAQYSKKECWDEVMRLINNPSSVDDTMMAKLYAYFMPAIPAKPKTDEQWIAKAMAKKDVRYYLNHIYCDGKRIMATNGHRLHIIHSDRYKKGFYDSQMNKVEVDATYPDVDRVIPSTRRKGNKRIAFEDLTASNVKIDGKNKPVFDIGEVRVDAKYLTEAAQGFENPEVIYADKNKAVLLTDGHRSAVVMPMMK